jgi:pimeloyl-ACP methyl ester carboxylesterase
LRISLWVAVVSATFGFACSSTFADEQVPIWTADNTGFINPADCNTFPNAHWLSVPLDPTHPDKVSFSLFYLLNHPMDKALPTALFIDGGPGGIVSPSRMPNQDRLDDSKWNLVSFRIRGAGCSQLPLDHSYDIDINSASVINDIESIRKNLGIASWDLVIGESFGSWLSQLYAYKNPGSLKHLYLEGIFNPAWVNAGGYSEALGNQLTKDLLFSLAMRDRSIFSPPLSLTEIQSISSKITPTLVQFDSANYSVPDNFGPYFLEAVSMSNYCGARAITPVLVEEQDAVIFSVLNVFFPNRVSSAQLQEANQKMSEGFSFDSPIQKIYPNISARVNLSFQNELNSVTQFNAQNIPTIYVDGSLDASTPIVGAKEMAKNSCGSLCLFVSANGGGHSGSNLTKDCLYAFMSDFQLDKMDQVQRTINQNPLCQKFSGTRADYVHGAR